MNNLFLKLVLLINTTLIVFVEFFCLDYVVKSFSFDYIITTTLYIIFSFAFTVHFNKLNKKNNIKSVVICSGLFAMFFSIILCCILMILSEIINIKYLNTEINQVFIVLYALGCYIFVKFFSKEEEQSLAI